MVGGDRCRAASGARAVAGPAQRVQLPSDEWVLSPSERAEDAQLRGGGDVQLVRVIKGQFAVTGGTSGGQVWRYEGRDRLIPKLKVRVQSSSLILVRMYVMRCSGHVAIDSPSEYTIVNSASRPQTSEPPWAHLRARLFSALGV